jgi:riboflavin synthase
MFTGIIETVGTIEQISAGGDGFRITVSNSAIADGSVPGDSVAVNGVCLTVTDISTPAVSFDAVKETASLTTVPEWKAGMKVNLERALTPESRLGGHIVQGHVDGTAVLTKRTDNRTGIDLWFKADEACLRYIAQKGSVAVDGVSLTVAELKDPEFRVSLVPYTLEQTALAGLKTGGSVNIETDIIGRYVERLLQSGGKNGLSLGKILESGFSGRRPGH